MRAVTRKRAQRGGAVVVAAAALLALGVGAGGAADPADLAVTKSDSPDPVAGGGLLTYTIEVANAGPDPAVSVAMTDDLPGGVDFVQATSTTGSCQRQGGRVECELGTIAAGGSATVEIQITVKKKKGAIENTASAGSETADPEAANDSDTETTTIAAGPTCRRRSADVVGTPGDDTLNGTSGNDVIVSGDGNDRVSAGGGKDVLCTGRGRDRVNAGGGNDFVKGGGGKDKLAGKRGGDTLKGNRGGDRLRGGSGNDLLAGGKGRDRCKGGSGRDTERGCER